MTLKVDTITNQAGTGAPDAPDGISVDGVALASVAQMTYSAASTAPEYPVNGQLWWDTSVSKLNIYANNNWYVLATT